MTRSLFALFQSPIDLSHDYWKSLIRPGDQVVDATCGNGHDSLFLAQLALDGKNGRFWGFDIQDQAIENTKNVLNQSLPKESVDRVLLIKDSHANILRYVEKESISLLVYNLGYLPGGNKAIVTKSEETLESLKAACIATKPGGAISVTCYPGHPEGNTEQEQIVNFATLLPPKNWSVVFHHWLNRKKSPTLILIQKMT